MPIGTIEELLQHIDAQVQNNPALFQNIKLELSKITRIVYADAITQNTGYCMTFKIPEMQVYELLNLLNLDKNTVKQTFIADWNVPSTSHMVTNVYYHTLLLLFAYGIRKKDETIQKNALTLILIKLWNGRRIKFIKYCNPDIMRYVIANLNGKYNARKYESPMTVILQHFVPTLIKKYGERINRDPKATKTLFEQSWVRFTQTFISRKIVDLETGVKKARSGLAPLYYAASEQNLRISKAGSNVDAVNTDNEASHSDYYSSDDNDELISQITNNIVMNFNAISSYDKEFLKFLNEVTKVNSQSIEILLGGMHNIEYTEYIHEIIELMFKQLTGNLNPENICSPNFINVTIKKRIISSKHSIIVTQLKNMVDMLLEKIFDKVVVYYKYSSYSLPRQGHLRKIIFYGIGYNMQKFICKGM